MAKSYQKMTMQLKGFDDFIEKLQEAGKDIDVEGRKCFEQCAENAYDALYENGKKAGLPERLLEEMDDTMIEKYGIWYYEVGWKKPKWKAEGEIPDAYKVLFFNYGSPRRTTKEGGQRVQINGQWVTLSTDRGTESPHPEGSHGFIKKAKISAASKNKKVMSNTLKKILGELEK